MLPPSRASPFCTGVHRMNSLLNLTTVVIAILSIDEMALDRAKDLIPRLKPLSASSVLRTQITDISVHRAIGLLLQAPWLIGKRD